MKHYFFKVKFVAFCTIACSVLSVACLAAIPMLHKKLFDTLSEDWNMNTLITLSLLYGAAFFFCCLFEYFSQRTAWKLDWKIHTELRSDLYNGICEKSFKEFEKIGIGEYLSKFQNDVDVVTAYINSGVNLIKYVLQIVVYFTYIVTLDWRILTIIIVGTIISLAAPKITGKEFSHRKTVWLGKQGIYLDTIKDLFHGFSENNYKTKEQLKKHHQENLLGAEDSMLNYGKFSAFVHVFNGSVLYAINLLCFITVGLLYFAGRITSGTGVAALGYVNSFIDPLRYLIEEISNMKASKGVAAELVNFINSNSKKDCGTDVKDSVEKIELVNVNKRFGNFELRDINLSFEKGKSYAVIGQNGSGKSTLFKLISGADHVDAGKILFDEVSTEDFNVSDRVFSMSSSSHIFNCDVRNNITVFGSYDIDGPHQDFFESLCQEQQNKIKENKAATKLSSGERERLTFVRALLAGFPVILFDEPFSAMDKEKSRVLKTLLQDLKDRILITITHDLSSTNLKDFDVIVVMEHGTVKIKGTPEEIMGSEYYAELVK